MPNTDNEESKWKCAWCQNLYAEKDQCYWNINGGKICVDCRNNFGTICESCEEILHIDNVYNYQQCQLCAGCYESRNEESRDYSDLDIYRNVSNRSYKFLSNNSGDIIKSTRPFGIEIEFLSNANSDSLYDFASKLPSQYGIEPDGSLNGGGIDLEVQTPKLGGDTGEKQVFETCRLVNEVAEGFVNRSCGLHLHIDTRDLTRTPKYSIVAKRIFQFYYVFEDVIMAMLPKSRRDDGYCKRLNPDFKERDFRRHYDVDDLEKLWYGTPDKREIDNRKKTKDETRYFGLNLHSMLANEHLEVRYHGGTINPTKICNWVALHLHIVDTIANGFECNGQMIYDKRINSLDSNSAEMRKTVNIQDKVDSFYNILELPDTLKDYYDARINKFNDNIIVRKEEKKPTKIEDTEVDINDMQIPSVVVRPLDTVDWNLGDEDADNQVDDDENNNIEL